MFPLPNNRHHPTKASVAETNHTEMTCIESYDDDTQHQRHQRQVMVFPKWVSASRDSCNEDSVSCLSSDEADSHRRRNIFSKHWEKQPNGKLASKRSRPFPKEKIVTHHCPFTSETKDENNNKEENDSGNSYERTLQMQEGSKLPSEVVNHDRRRIFAGCTSSRKPTRSTSCCFAMSPQLSVTSRRNAISDSALIVKKLIPCLRPPKYSCGDPSRHTDRSVSVSFSASISIVKYEIPQEQWAASGWSNFFY